MQAHHCPHHFLVPQEKTRLLGLTFDLDPSVEVGIQTPVEDLVEVGQKASCWQEER